MNEPSDDFGPFSPDKQYFIERHIQGFLTGSDRVRKILIFALAASLLVLVSYRNSFSEGWFLKRLEIARKAQVAQVWQPNISEVLNECRAKAASGKDRDECDTLDRAIQWFKLSRHDEKSLNKYVDKLQDSTVREIMFIRLPVIGTAFDINDLGFFSSCGLLIIYFVLYYALSRHAENLYFCLWMIRRLAAREMRFNDALSRANFFYHMLAMGQVLSRPRTLARWHGTGLSRWFSRAIFAVPITVQALVLIHDLRTIDRGNVFSPWNTDFTITIHKVMFLALLVLTLLTFSCAIGTDRRWDATFREINPAFKFLRKPGLLRWILPRFQPRYRFRQLRTLCLVDVDNGLLWKGAEETGGVSVLSRASAEKATERGAGFPLRTFDLFRLRDMWSYSYSRPLDGNGQYKITGARYPESLPSGTSGADRHHVWVGQVVGSEPPRDDDQKSEEWSPAGLVEVDGDRLIRIEAGESQPFLTAKLRAKGKLYSRRRFEELAVLNKEAIVVDWDEVGVWIIPIDQRGTLPTSEGQHFYHSDRHWRPVAVATCGTDLLIAETPRFPLRWLMRLRGQVVRVRRTTPEVIRASAKSGLRSESGTPWILGRWRQAK